jgi:glycine/D-amino acid oxidase-like deaminating enzyme/nitrite reductase/ring-hydroxylating ferredoxin subunit
MDSSDSLWSSTAATPGYPQVTTNVHTDVLVIGGGITGLTAALRLAEAGLSVTLVEARRLGSGVSHRSTVHMTEMVDSWYTDIESSFGKEGARLVARSSRAALDEIAKLAEARSGVERKPGYLYTETADHVDWLREEYEAARRAGLSVSLLPSAPLPYPTRGALLFPDQLQLHVVRYLAGLAEAAAARGARIHEGSRVVAVEDGEPCLAHLENGPVIRAKHVFVATDAPLNRVFLQTKIAAYRSYVLAFRGAELTSGLFWDTADPYHYLSPYSIDGVPYLLVGGEDHKTGATSKTAERFDSLLSWTKARLSVAEPDFRWSAQVRESVDGLPFIGRNSASEHVYVATGFSGNGTTFGTIAAMIVSDLIMGRTNPWADLYSATRVKPVTSATAYVGENVDFPIHLLTDRLAPPEARTVEDIPPGEGKTLLVQGERLAVYRDEAGALHAVSSVCTHLGCIVKFNRAEKTWDCPCHGSRFGVDGAVHDGPATRPLERRRIEPSIEPRRESGTLRTAPLPEAAPRRGGKS